MSRSISLKFIEVPAVLALKRLDVAARTQRIERFSAIVDDMRKSVDKISNQGDQAVKSKIRCLKNAQAEEIEALKAKHAQSSAELVDNYMKIVQNAEAKGQADLAASQRRINQLVQEAERAQESLHNFRRNQKQDLQDTVKAERDRARALLEEKDKSIARLEKDRIWLQKNSAAERAELSKALDSKDRDHKEQLQVLKASWNEEVEGLRFELKEVLAKNKQLESDAQDNALEGAHSQKKGRQAELAIEEYLAELPCVLSIEDMSSKPQSGDFHIRTLEGKRFLIEVKNYSQKVRGSQVEKFLRDLRECGECIDGALFISMQTGIVLPKETELGLNWSNGLPVYYVAEAISQPDAICNAIHTLTRAPCLLPGTVPEKDALRLRDLLQEEEHLEKLAARAQKKYQDKVGEVRMLATALYAPAST